MTKLSNSVLCSQLFCHFVTAHTRHADIQQQNVRPECPRFFNRLRSVEGGLNIVSPVF